LESRERRARPQGGRREHALGDARAAEDRPHRLPVADRALRRPRAEFLYVPTKEVLATAKERDATPYDIPDVHFSHEGERCSFDAFLKHYRLTDPALGQLAVIVRGADTARLDLAPQAPGLAAISLGLSRNFADDHEMLKHGMVMYDALYAWCKSGQEEVHTWNPTAYR